MTKDDTLLQDLMLLSKAAQIVLQEEVLEGLPETGIGPTKMNLMRLLWRQRRQTVNDLARFLGQTKAAASQNVDSLVKSGLVKRQPDKVDRRCVWVSLTPKGTRVLKKAEALQMQALKKAIRGVSKTTLDRGSLAMRALANALLESSAGRQGSCLQCCAYNTSGCVYEGERWRCSYLLRGESPPSKA